MKQLERLLFLQGNRCFFCGESISQGEASVEHLVANANGGTKDDVNCVVCCKAVNAALGHLPLKLKLSALLSHRHGFKCPANRGVDAGGTVPSVAGDLPDRLTAVIADLRKRGAARPRRIGTLKNTVNALFKMSLSDGELNAIVEDLQRRGYVIVSESQVSYALPQTGA
jgi:hypothetical protein